MSLDVLVTAGSRRLPRVRAFRRAMVQTHLDGPGYTIDMLCDVAGQPLSIVRGRATSSAPASPTAAAP